MKLNLPTTTLYTVHTCVYTVILDTQREATKSLDKLMHKMVVFERMYFMTGFMLDSPKVRVINLSEAICEMALKRREEGFLCTLYRFEISLFFSCIPMTPNISLYIVHSTQSNTIYSSMFIVHIYQHKGIEKCNTHIFYMN